MVAKVGIIVGSLRKESLNRKLALNLMKLAPDTIQSELIDIKDLTLYNEDLDDDVPSAWTTFREAVKKQDGLLFVTPEYNRSIPGPLKNAIDVGSRPYGHSVWAGKPGAVISGSPGAIGGFGANHHLRQSLVFLDVLCMQQPEAYISHFGQMFDDKGEVVKEETRQFLSQFMASFAKWVNKIIA